MRSLMAVTGGWLRSSTGKVNAGKLYGRKSEKSGRLSKRRDDDDRSSGKDNFDGTPGSDKESDAASGLRR